MWALLSLPIIWGRRHKVKQCHSSQDFLAHWSLDAAWIGLMAEVEKIFSGVDCKDSCKQKLGRCKSAEV